MGTWNASIFGDDFALDVREQYLGYLADGLDDAEATRRIVGDPVELRRDPDEHRVLWLALAATQWEYGRLVPDVKARALALIDDAEELARWPESSRRARKAALGALRRKLLSPPPKSKRPRRRESIEVPSQTIDGPDGITSATAFEIGDGQGRLVQVMISVKSDGHESDGCVFAAGCGYMEIGLRWLDTSALEITYPEAASTHKRDDGYFHCGRTIKCVYRMRGKSLDR